jgi:imidazoleglycerol-phosphate dehydratase
MKAISRTTKETSITCEFQSVAPTKIVTQIAFFNHMLEAMFYYANIRLNLTATGDTDVDDHHLVEDCGLVLGQALRAYLNDLKGFTRFGYQYVPMDESLARAVVDLSNRPTLVYQANYHNEKVGSLTLQNVKEFFKAFATEARITLHLEVLYGDNDHHQVEALFKACGLALKQALSISDIIPSTKGVL